MPKHNPRDHQYFQEMLATVLEILRQLNADYDFHFALGYMHFDSITKQEIASNLHFNQNITKYPLDVIISNLQQVQQERERMWQAVATCMLVVTCVDDKNQPNDLGNNVIQGNWYVVKNVKRSDIPGKFVYDLHDMKVNPPYVGYKSERFRKLTLVPQLN